ncbi:MAG: hypothetical protein GXO66_08725 [Euryarchaeota archaeon]|nr:hypothetical protein [Euryarchaeota archaeon]
MSRVKLVACLAALGLLLLSCTGLAAEGGSKVVVVHMNIKEGVVTELYSKVVYNYPPSYLRGQFKSEVLSADGRVLREFSVWDPRVRIGREVVFVDNVNFTVVLPFSSDMKTFNLYDKRTGEKLISVDLTEAIVGFCREHRDDPECAEALKNLDSGEGFASIATVAVIVALAGLAAAVLLRKGKK